MAPLVPLAVVRLVKKVDRDIMGPIVALLLTAADIVLSDEVEAGLRWRSWLDPDCALMEQGPFAAGLPELVFEPQDGPCHVTRFRFVHKDGKLSARVSGFDKADPYPPLWNLFALLEHTCRTQRYAFTTVPMMLAVEQVGRNYFEGAGPKTLGKIATEIALDDYVEKG